MAEDTIVSMCKSLDPKVLMLYSVGYLASPKFIPLTCTILESLLQTPAKSGLLPDNINYNKQLDGSNSRGTGECMQWPSLEDFDSSAIPSEHIETLKDVPAPLYFILSKMKSVLTSHFEIMFGTETRVNIFNLEMCYLNHKGKHCIQFTYDNDQNELQDQKMAKYMASEQQKRDPVYAVPKGIDPATL